MNDFKIDKGKCTRCGLCAKDCPAGVIEMPEYPILEKEGCFKCEHCLAICPTGALSILGTSPDDCITLEGALPSNEQMEALIKGRRTCRSYKDENVDASTINKLLDIAWHAPTGVNSQSVSLTILRDKESTYALREEIYTRLEEMLTKGDAADNPMLNYFENGVKGWKRDRSDLIFRTAPHVLIATAPANTPCPEADTHIYLSYFELMANTMGLGTVWCGLLKAVITEIFPDIRDRLGIPQDHTFGYVMLFGIPAIKYQRSVERGSARVQDASWTGE